MRLLAFGIATAWAYVIKLGPGTPIDYGWPGLLRAEKPIGPRHGLHLWTSLPPDRKLAEPA
jgi:hypothetical protein